jgi:hypothetical protein
MLKIKAKLEASVESVESVEDYASLRRLQSASSRVSDMKLGEISRLRIEMSRLWINRLIN